MERIVAQQRQLEGQALRLEADRRRLMMQVNHIDAQLRGLRARIAYLCKEMPIEALITSRSPGSIVLTSGDDR